MMMRKAVFIILIVAVVVYLAGCGKKQKSLEEMQEPMSMEQLSNLNAENKNPPGVKVQEPQPAPAQVPASAVSLAPARLEPLPPSGPFSPTAIDIQMALKNAGYYTGKIDGKIGPQSKKAIEDFQKSSGLKADGKVGPKTWEALRKYLNLAAPTFQDGPVANR